MCRIVLSQGMFRMFAIGAAIALLTACGDWPEVPNVAASNAKGAWPTLTPVSGFPSVATDDHDTQTQSLLARARALRARAALLRRPVDNQDDLERLRRLISR